MQRLETISDLNAFNNQGTFHPLVTVIDQTKSTPRHMERRYYGFYAAFLKGALHGNLRYGKQNYDYQEGTLVFFGPGQVVGEDNGAFYQPDGLVLAFHPDLIRGTSLGQHIQDYTFFSYDVSEALHISEKERQTVRDCFAQIDAELRQPIDKHSKKLIVSGIELFLNYCTRFYDRQFITRENVNRGILERFEGLLNDYFSSDKPQLIGLPSVAWCAAELHLSPNYFGDLIKKETGKSPLEYIQSKVIDLAKEKIFDDAKSVSEIAYDLGFKYPQHFSRLFKQRVGLTPNEYRGLN
ncbi:MAG TPA: helix-turn-helix transcriptional regulator [Dinghuibacter sp.]|jgi:AraC-like DNA-binding protein|uniref:helix-turn-helix domain-containing protein n=1 Tax=Dinghuibacter sp. TaxID=2024697 RepID=UPI002BF4CA57|nr:helix-turn-helix transcriptional regulator [Dinghuibacter sp.]HTJ14352.1 helix-turn-helix transcriptional regulator [Dinghuibacter sp.]